MSTARRCATVLAPAKINLFLCVRGSRPDGYHELCSVMQAVSLFDRLTFRVRGDGRLRLRCSGEAVPAGEDNLVLRAARLLKQDYEVAAGADITLEKRIPVGSGFGGASADGAVTLMVLNDLWGVGADGPRLARLAERVGSDVPFFLWGGTALVEGRGEAVRPVRPGGVFHYVLVFPPEPVVTAQVYRQWDCTLTKCNRSPKNVLAAVAQGDVERLGRSLHNDLEEPAFGVCQSLRRVSELLEKMVCEGRVAGALLSGSGGGFFAVCDSLAQARAVAREVEQASGLRAVAVRSLNGWQLDWTPLREGRWQS